MNENLRLLQSQRIGRCLQERYDVIEYIGGAESNIYLARDRASENALRAVREIDLSSFNEAQQQAFLRIGKLHLKLCRERLLDRMVNIYDQFLHENCYYHVMEFFNGGDLHMRLKSSPGGFIDERTVTAWAIEICEILSRLHCHQEYMVHRNLRPSNIFIDGTDGSIRIDECNIVYCPSSAPKTPRMSGFLAPEGHIGPVEVTSDIYSVGMIIFYLLTGINPDENLAAFIDFYKNRQLTNFNESITHEMNIIVTRATAAKPHARYPHTGQLQEALKAHLAMLTAGEYFR